MSISPSPTIPFSTAKNDNHSVYHSPDRHRLAVKLQGLISVWGAEKVIKEYTGAERDVQKNSRFSADVNQARDHLLTQAIDMIHLSVEKPEGQALLMTAGRLLDLGLEWPSAKTLDFKVVP